MVVGDLVAVVGMRRIVRVLLEIVVAKVVLQVGVVGYGDTCNGVNERRELSPSLGRLCVRLES